MDITILFQEFAKAGLLPLAMAIVIWALKKDLDKERDKTASLTEKTIEQFYSAKDQADSFLELLVSMKEILIKLDAKSSRRSR